MNLGEMDVNHARDLLDHHASLVATRAIAAGKPSELGPYVDSYFDSIDAPQFIELLVAVHGLQKAKEVLVVCTPVPLIALIQINIKSAIKQRAMTIVANRQHLHD